MHRFHAGRFLSDMCASIIEGYSLLSSPSQLSRPLLGTAAMGISGWREILTTCRRVQEKEEWSSASTMPGGPSAAISFEEKMLRWCVNT